MAMEWVVWLAGWGASPLEVATKEAYRYMSKPTDKDERRAKRLGRYLKEHRRVVQQFGWQDDGEEVLESNYEHGTVAVIERHVRCAEANR